MEQATHYIRWSFTWCAPTRWATGSRNLERKPAEGKPVWFLYDDIGSFSLSAAGSTN